PALSTSGTLSEQKRITLHEPTNQLTQHKASAMKILVFNAGSSSLKFGIFDLAQADSRVFKGEFENFQASGSTLHFRYGGTGEREHSRAEAASDLKAAFARVPAILKEFGYADFHAVGHRVVHGGAEFRTAALIDVDVIRRIEECSVLAPLHNPQSLVGILKCIDLWPSLPQVAVFDTAFHQSVSAYAYTYAVPQTWRERGLRRYGFHGTSHHYVAQRVAEELNQPLQDLHIISC